MVIFSSMSGCERQKFVVCLEMLCVGVHVLECIGVFNLQGAELICIQRPNTGCKMKCWLENPDHSVHWFEMLKTHWSQQDLRGLSPSAVQIASVRHQETRCLQLTKSFRHHLHLPSLPIPLLAKAEVCTHRWVWEVCAWQTKYIRGWWDCHFCEATQSTTGCECQSAEQNSDSAEGSGEIPNYSGAKFLSV